jgi:hypothetical protein
MSNTVIQLMLWAMAGVVLVALLSRRRKRRALR